MVKPKFGTCVHCKNYRIIHARGLCKTCHKDHDVRDMYAADVRDEFVHTAVFISDPFENSNFYNGAPGWSTSINPFM